MPRWTDQQRVCYVEQYFRSGGSYKKADEAFSREMGIPSPFKSISSKWVKKFKNLGTVQNQNKGNSGRPITSTAPDKVELVRRSVGQSPKKSTRRRSQELGIERTALMRILHNLTAINAYITYQVSMLLIVAAVGWLLFFCTNLY